MSFTERDVNKSFLGLLAHLISDSELICFFKAAYSTEFFSGFFFDIVTE